jgi:hypothetical protein
MAFRSLLPLLILLFTGCAAPAAGAADVSLDDGDLRAEDWFPPTPPVSKADLTIRYEQTSESQGFRVTNTGGAATPGFWIEIRPHARAPYSIQVPSGLGSGESAWFAFTLDCRRSAEIVVDPQVRVVESVRTNNTLSVNGWCGL